MFISGVIFLLGVLYFIKEENKANRINEAKTLSKLYEAIDKISTKNNKEFYKLFKDLIRKSVQEIPKPIEADNLENSIEQSSGPEDIPLSEMDRIPIVDGVKIKLDDGEESLPININPVENYQDKNQNPIEK